MIITQINKKAMSFVLPAVLLFGWYRIKNSLSVFFELFTDIKMTSYKDKLCLHIAGRIKDIANKTYNAPAKTPALSTVGVILCTDPSRYFEAGI